jgi:phage anti-repressor protein
MININKENKLDAEELHKKLESKTQYHKWIDRKIKEADLQEGIDFWSYLTKSTGGRPKTIYEFTIDAAKEVALLERNDKGKEIRRWLIGLSNKVEDGDLLSREQILYLTKLKTVFKYIENCDEAQKMNMASFVNGSTSKYVYADFHKMRNNILKLDKEIIDKRIKDFCIENNKNYIGKTKNIHVRMIQHFSFISHLPKECYDLTQNIDYITLDSQKEMVEVLVVIFQKLARLEQVFTNPLIKEE